MAIKRLAFYLLALQLNIRRSVVKESILYLNMEEKLVRVNWKRGQYSDVDRVDVVNPSPLKVGQKVTVIWGERGKEYSATIDKYPVSLPPVMTPRKAPEAPKSKAKRKLVSQIRYVLREIKERV